MSDQNIVASSEIKDTPAILGKSTQCEGVKGESTSSTHAALAGIQLNPNSTGAGVYGEHKGKGAGGVFISKDSVGMRCETNSKTIAALEAVSNNPNKDANGWGAPGVWATSQAGEAVHGESHSDTFAAIAGIQVNPNSTGAGVYGEHKGKGAGGAFFSKDSVGIHCETHSNSLAAIAVHSKNPQKDANGFGAPGVWATSQAGEAVHGESHSDVFAAIAGIQLNPNSTGAGIYGEHLGGKFAGYFKGNVEITGKLTVQGREVMAIPVQEFQDLLKRVHQLEDAYNKIKSALDKGGGIVDDIGKAVDDAGKFLGKIV